MSTGILGGTFDPPHNGHVALARAALAELPIDRLVVLVAARPGHRGDVLAGPDDRLALARAAFDGLASVVDIDQHPFTADSVSGGRFGDAIFIVGADEGRDFPGWKEPEEVLRWVRLAVGTRSGYPPPDLERYGDRILSFELDSPDVSSSDLRERISKSETVSGLIPEAVLREVEERSLYGYTGRKQERT